MRHGLNRWRDLESGEPVICYERATPGEMVHIDIKKLGKFNRVGQRISKDRHGQSTQRCNGTTPGWEFVHVCVDDHSRIAFSQVLENERKECAIAFLKAALAWYQGIGIRIDRVMTDNGSCYKSKAFAAACKELGIKHIRTKPYASKIYLQDIPPRPMEKPSASSSHLCEKGPMPAHMPLRINVKLNWPTGCITTIGTDRMPV